MESLEKKTGDTCCEMLIGSNRLCNLLLADRVLESLLWCIILNYKHLLCEISNLCHANSVSLLCAGVLLLISSTPRPQKPLEKWLHHGLNLFHVCQLRGTNPTHQRKCSKADQLTSAIIGHLNLLWKDTCCKKIQRLSMACALGD